MTDAENEIVFLQNLSTKLEITVGGVVELVSVLLTPNYKGLFPAGKLRSGWSFERDLTTLIFRKAVVSVNTEPAPVVVGVVGIAADLQQDFRILSGFRGPNDEVSI